MENHSKELSEIAVNILGVYMSGAELIIQGSQNKEPGEENYLEIRQFRDNYRQYLDLFRDSIREQEAKAHENTIKRLGQFFELID